MAELSPRGRSPRKKLREAARLWARGDLVEAEDAAEEETKANASYAEALAALGFELVEPVRVAPQQHYAIWPENWPVFSRFIHEQRRLWRHGFDGAVGLDAQAVGDFIGRHAPRGARRSASEQRDELRGLLAAMEDGALVGWEELREQRRKEQEDRRRD